MERYGWTINEVKQQPYFEVLDLLSLNKENEQKDEETSESSSEKVYTGSDLKLLFGN
ncbi:hypothetical protein [Staphylococcus haemolyticus]|uniref:hypothetical protein n=1 Tax=Staphylococcus haemolyticus TaxID=1283 RepID=UPI00051DE2EE|nr:hypothetical protein [Staphylococcus haemolyticus]KGJ25386.1 phage protein [Staphylococcus haemolyticus]KGJ29228.1 phage protein [Staphylococcus haemolyticus]MCH4326226.1 hypothetical protein [Staphylococcus haemolyticus]MCH4414249.1 hypothetical protein [Staphylococcus haemolyticus]MCH4419059.1 hypothetical protein [Staphylococcus haemolyticus]